MNWTALSALLLTFFVTVSPVWAAEPQASVDPACVVGEAAPADVQAVRELPSGLFEIKLRNGMVFNLKGNSPIEAGRLTAMTKEQKETFFARRKEMLTFLAKFLAFPRAMGAMSWAGSAVKGCFRRSQTNTAEDILQVHIGQSMQDGSRLQVLGYQMIAQILSIADEQIWRDAKTYIASKSGAFVFILGTSGGVAAVNVGSFRMLGIQIDFATDFETHKAFFRRGMVKQKFKDGLFVFEAMVMIGLMRQYQVDSTLPSEDSTLVNLPLGLAYRFSDNSVAAGMLAGVNLFDLAGAGLLTMGQPVAGGTMLFLARLTTFFSLYRTNSTVVLSKATEWGAFKEWLTGFMSRRRGCEAELHSGSNADLNNKNNSNTRD